MVAPARHETVRWAAVAAAPAAAPVHQFAPLAVVVARWPPAQHVRRHRRRPVEVVSAVAGADGGGRSQTVDAVPVVRPPVWFAGLVEVVAMESAEFVVVQSSAQQSAAVAIVLVPVSRAPMAAAFVGCSAHSFSSAYRDRCSSERAYSNAPPCNVESGERSSERVCKTS